MTAQILKFRQTVTRTRPQRIYIRTSSLSATIIILPEIEQRHEQAHQAAEAPARQYQATPWDQGGPASFADWWTDRINSSKDHAVEQAVRIPDAPTESTGADLP